MRQCARIVEGAAMNFPPHFWRYFTILWAAVLGLLGAAIWLDNHRDLFETQPTSRVEILSEKMMLDKGHELLRLGNCMACHTRADKGNYDDDSVTYPKGLPARFRTGWND